MTSSLSEEKDAKLGSSGGETSMESGDGACLQESRHSSATCIEGWPAHLGIPMKISFVDVDTESSLVDSFVVVETNTGVYPCRFRPF